MEKKKVLSADDILSADDMEVAHVECPEWGGVVAVKTMTGAERDAFEMSMSESNKKGAKKAARLENLRARFIAATAVDEKGAPLFTSAQVAALGKKSAKALDRCVDAARDLNGMFDSAVEDAEGN